MLFLLLFLSHSSALATTDSGWVIERFFSKIFIAKDTSVLVTETITVDFKKLSKHGIFRNIPVEYKTSAGNNLNIHLKVISVTNSSGQKIPYKLTRTGKQITIKIGDPGKTVSGKKTYVISYKVQRVLLRQKQEAELYWNVTGNNWPVTILSAQAEVRAFDKTPLKRAICFTGHVGSKKTSCKYDAQNNTAYFTAENIKPGEGLTIATLFNKSDFLFPSLIQEIAWFFLDNWAYFIPIAVLIIMTSLYWTRGRDKKYRYLLREKGVKTVGLFEKINALTTFSPPKNLSPGEVGVLADEVVNMRDITAIFIDLARRGYLTIKEIPGEGLVKRRDFEIKLNQKDESELKDFEKSILDMLFGKKRKTKVVLRKLEKDSYKYLEEAKKKLYKHLSEEGYFEGNPDSVRKRYFIIGFVVLIYGTAIFSGLSILSLFSIQGSIAAIASGLIIMFFAFFMPAKTPKGRKALMQVAGLREYLKTGAWRQKIYEEHNFFEEALPYTIVFGLTKKFINAFKDADIKRLDWYKSKGPISSQSFAYSLGYIGKDLTKGVTASKPRTASSGRSGFGGSGSSGGGFGGGGGGSW